MKQNGEKISMLTAYDYTLARIVDGAGIDVILVGDSASNVMAGHETTLPITLDEMIYHASSVVRAIDRALVVVDMPFGSYQGNSLEALSSAIRIMKESGGHSVKLEGGSEIIESIERILTAGIPVMGHLGLTPQSIYKFGTYTVRAKEEVEAEKVAARMPEIMVWQREKVQSRFEEAKVELDPGRFEQEMIMLAQKVDVAEELDRLNAHVKETRNILRKGGAVGRRLDFMMQEFNRESNTLGSKSITTDITQSAVELKVLIEQMREQIQNVE